MKTQEFKNITAMLTEAWKVIKDEALSIHVKAVSEDTKSDTLRFYIQVGDEASLRSMTSYHYLKGMPEDSAQTVAMALAVFKFKGIVAVVDEGTNVEEKEVPPANVPEKKEEEKPKKVTKKTTKKRNKNVVYDRSITAHKNALGALFSKLEPKWAQTPEIKQRAIKLSAELEGKEMLDGKGNMLESFIEEVKEGLNA